MNVTKFNFKVRYQGDTIPAGCQVIQYAAHPQYRVSLVAEDGMEKIFIFYKVNQHNKMFFWFPLDGQKEVLAKSIAQSLEKDTN